MVFQQTTIQTDDRVATWHDRLDEVVRHVAPWTCAAGGMPECVHRWPAIVELVSMMDKSVSRLTRMIAEQQARVADSWSVAYIERELANLLDVAREFDDALRKTPVSKPQVQGLQPSFD